MNKTTLVYYHKDEIDGLLESFGYLSSGKFKEPSGKPSKKACMDLIDEAERLLITATDDAYSAVINQQLSGERSALERVLLAKHSHTLTQMHKSIISMRKSTESEKYDAVMLTADKIYPAVMDLFTATEINISAPSQPTESAEEPDEMEQILNSTT